VWEKCSFLSLLSGRTHFADRQKHYAMNMNEQHHPSPQVTWPCWMKNHVQAEENQGQHKLWLCFEIRVIILQGFYVLIWGGHVLMALTRAAWYFVSPELILHLSTNTSLCTVGRGDNMPLWCITTTHGADCKETISARRAGNYILNPFIVLIYPSWCL
jgi:hypothetical protein